MSFRNRQPDVLQPMVNAPEKGLLKRAPGVVAIVFAILVVNVIFCMAGEFMNLRAARESAHTAPPPAPIVQ